jgi:hypothetical protein
VRGTIVGLVGVMLAVSACSSGSPGGSPTISHTPSQSPSSASGTRVVYVRPTLPDHSLKPGYRITNPEHDVTCWQYDTAGVVRCDPYTNAINYYCWKFIPSKPSTATMACLVKPWGRDVVAVNLAKGEHAPKPEPVTPGLGDAIGLQLSDGQRCEALYGALNALDDAPTAPLNSYSCPTVDLFGDYKQTKPLWTIKAAYGWDGKKYNRLATVPIAAAYFVQPDS